MPRIKVDFPSADGHQLSGSLETPPGNLPIARYALFAHCFTCGKDSTTASRISRALAGRGIAVLRFDFTGLGGSEGDFANSNFSSNVADLLAAAKKLEQDFQAPALLIGHSLGGAAVLAAAAQLPSVEAVATIAAPATARHVRHLFGSALEALESKGEAEIQVGQRRFPVKRQMLEDIDRYADPSHIRDLRKALLVFHSPLDEVVPIEEAGKIYQAALHPKSFISLDQADHLLSKRADAEYVAETLLAWAGRYLDLDRQIADSSYRHGPHADEGEVIVSELDKAFLRGLYTRHHQWMADEPESVGGRALGPTPYDLLLMSLGACTSMTLRLYANHKKLPLEDVEVRLVHERIHARDCADCEQQDGKIERISRFVTLRGELSEDERQRLLEIADRCPVHRTLEARPHVTTTLVNDAGTQSRAK
jgi:putative redox protein